MKHRNLLELKAALCRQGIDNIKPGSYIDMLIWSVAGILDDFEDELFEDIFGDYLPGDGPFYHSENGKAGVPKCRHEWVDTGTKKSWCKLCNVNGELVDGQYVEVKK